MSDRLYAFDGAPVKAAEPMRAPWPQRGRRSGANADRPGGAPHRAPAIAELRGTIRALDRWGSQRGWRGSDPYEGLRARRVPWLRRSATGRRLLIQAVKRSPLDPRGLLGIRPGHDSAALAHVLSAYARMHSLGLSPAPQGRARVERLAELLGELRSPGFDEPCWGYHFDVETRFFGYGAGTPNTIATALVGLALLDGHEATGDAELLELAEGAGDFFLRRVERTPAPGGSYFGYFPGDRSPIHNANLLVCGLLARLGSRRERGDFLEAARSGVSYAVRRQRPDGSWPYAEDPRGAWVDNLHTGYVLDSLLRCARALRDDAARAAHERGLRFYADRLFLEDGTPKQRANRVHPIDAQCAAQGIQTLALSSRADRQWLERAWCVHGFAATRMRRADGAFCFQRGRLHVNPIPHVRWVQAPMLAALTTLYEASAEAVPVR